MTCFTLRARNHNLNLLTGESYDVEQGDCGPDSKFGPMQRGDVFKRFVPCAPIKFGSSGLLLQVAAGTGTGTGNRLSLNVESIIVRGIQLMELPNPPDDVLQLLVRLGAEHTGSKKIVLRR